MTEDGHDERAGLFPLSPTTTRKRKRTVANIYLTFSEIPGTSHEW
jgi:hypothetical protein